METRSITIITVGAVVVAAAIGAGWLAMAQRPAADGEPRAARPGPENPAAGKGFTLGGCGSRITGAARADADLVMSADLPGEQSGELIRFRTKIVNRGENTVRGITGRQPDVVLAQDGRVVGTPAAIRDVGVEIDLGPGESRDFETVVTTLGCEPGRGRLPAGTYQLYAEQRIEVQGREGNPERVQGGPWTIEIR